MNECIAKGTSKNGLTYQDAVFLNLKNLPCLSFLVFFYSPRLYTFRIMLVFKNLPLCLTLKSDPKVKKCAYYFH